MSRKSKKVEPKKWEENEVMSSYTGGWLTNHYRNVKKIDIPQVVRREEPILKREGR